MNERTNERTNEQFVCSITKCPSATENNEAGATASATTVAAAGTDEHECWLSAQPHPIEEERLPRQERQLQSLLRIRRKSIHDERPNGSTTDEHHPRQVNQFTDPYSDWLIDWVIDRSMDFSNCWFHFILRNPITVVAKQIAGSFIHSYTKTFIQSINSFINSFINSINPSSIHSFIHLFISL